MNLKFYCAYFEGRNGSIPNFEGSRTRDVDSLPSETDFSLEAEAER